MANNQYVNKVSYNGGVLIDLTQDTAEPQFVMKGKTFHKSDGSVGTGTAEMTYNSSTKELTVPSWLVTLT